MVRSTTSGACNPTVVENSPFARPGIVLGSTVTRVRAGTGTACTTLPAPDRRNVSVAVVWVSPGFTSERRMSKKPEVAPSAR